MATTFPENDVQIFRVYLTDGLHRELRKTRTELGRITVSGIPLASNFGQGRLPALSASEREQQGRAIATNVARSQLLGVLQRASLGGTDKPPAIVALDEIARMLERQDLRDALAGLDAFPSPASNLQLERTTISTAFTAESITYSRIEGEVHTSPTGATFDTRRRVFATLPAFEASARLTAAEIDQLFLVLSFLSTTPERTFRLGAMRGEVHLGLGEYDKAVQEYERVLGQLPTVVTPRRRFIALRNGSAHLGLGDMLFRGSRRPDSNARRRIRAEYAAAAGMAASNLISASNPLRQQIERYAAMQKAKLDAGMNILGYRDSYVPTLKPGKLQELAERRIQAAADAVDKFVVFQSTFDEIQDRLAELDFELDIKKVELDIAEEEIARAEDQKSIATEQIERIEGQLDSLDVGLGVDIGGALLEGAAFAFLAATTGGAGAGGVVGTSIPGVVGAVSGGASALASYLARKKDLESQKKIAEIEDGIAERDIGIAHLRKEIVEITLDLLSDKVRRIQSGELDPDLYHAAAAAFRELAVRHLDTAIRWSYLFERAVYFLRLEPDLPKIKLDYLSGRGGLLAAPSRLRADLGNLVDLNVPITKFQFLAETYSLRSLYPLEFNRFLQTGVMDFSLSLYELNKRRPGVHRQRIKRVQVELQFPPPSGFTGRIRHRGSFLLRDKDTTPEPGAGSFVPDEEQLEQAFAVLGAGAAQGSSIGGVMPFLLDVDTIELSPDQTFPDLENPEPDALMPIEGYGPAGNWTLEVDNVDLRFITDALLKITYVIPESDESLQSRVKRLIAAYEQEQLLAGEAPDLISTFSLRRQFPNVLAQLGSGSAQLRLGRSDFPSGVTGLELKTIVIQALDAEAKAVEGLAIEIGKPGTSFRLERSTRPDGFTEDVTATIPVLPPEQRFPVEGTYELRLPDPAQLSAVNDLLVFFVYEVQVI